MRGCGLTTGPAQVVVAAVGLDGPSTAAAAGPLRGAKSAGLARELPDMTPADCCGVLLALDAREDPHDGKSVLGLPNEGVELPSQVLRSVSKLAQRFGFSRRKA
mmetsp:Transcript_44025/g.131468  ORF Transcript_44025/g.131468 Transcript_44025/m.131468 type:complete len:104 (+) Transcript_44025:786-1097(+)